MPIAYYEYASVDFMSRMHYNKLRNPCGLHYFFCGPAMRRNNMRKMIISIVAIVTIAGIAITALAISENY